MRNQRGITLVALVVTIIILIILAGVSINMVVGDNGIITQAQRAARETAEEAVEKVAKETAQETAEEVAERAAKETTQEAVERVTKETAEETTTTLNKVVREESGKTGGDGVQTSGPVRETKIDEVKNTGTENIGDIKQVRIEGRRKIYTNPSGNEVSWVDQSPKDIQAIINSRLKSSIDRWRYFRGAGGTSCTRNGAFKG